MASGALHHQVVPGYPTAGMAEGVGRGRGEVRGVQRTDSDQEGPPCIGVLSKALAYSR